MGRPGSDCPPSSHRVPARFRSPFPRTVSQNFLHPKVIVDPAHPPDLLSDDQLHLGANRHSVLPMDGGKWLVSLRDPPPAPLPAGVGFVRRANPRVYDPTTGALEDFQPLTPGAGALSEVAHPIKQVVRTADGSLVAMSAGGTYTPVGETVASDAAVLHCDSAGVWSAVHGFPAGNLPGGLP